MTRTLLEMAALAWLFAGGFALAVALLGARRPWRSVYAAFPLGCGLWAACWMFFALAFPGSWDAVLAGAMLCHAALTLGFAARARRRWYVAGGGLARGLFGLAAAAVIGTVAGRMSGYFVSGDSLIMSAWHAHPRISLVQGYPLFNLALANLARLVGIDIYLHSVHVLQALSLLFLLGEAVHERARRAGRSAAAALAAALAAAALVATTRMFLLQAVYINHHVAFAVFLLLFLTVARDEYPSPALAAVCLFFLLLTRSEGFLFALIALACMAGGPGRGNADLAWRVAVRFTPLALPYAICLAFLYGPFAFVGRGQHLILLAGMAALVAALAARRRRGPAWLWKHVWLLLPGAAFLGLAAATALRFSFMSRSLTGFGAGVFDPRFFGFTIPFVLLTMAVAAAGRFRQGTGWSRDDLPAVLFLVALPAIPALSVFDDPCAHSMSASGTRIIFHFLPAAVLWSGWTLAAWPPGNGKERSR